MAIWKVVLTGEYYAQNCQNVVHFAAAAATPDEQLIESLRVHWLQAVRPLQNQGFVWTTISAQRIDAPIQPPTVIPVPQLPGGLLGVGYHPSIAWLFSLRTAFAGRHGRGRIYIPGVHGESVLNGKAEGAALQAAQQVALALFQNYGLGGTEGYQLVVLPRADPAAYHTVTNIIVRPTFGLQRRRNINVGA